MPACPPARTSSLPARRPGGHPPSFALGELRRGRQRETRRTGLYTPVWAGKSLPSSSAFGAGVIRLTMTRAPMEMIAEG